MINLLKKKNVLDSTIIQSFNIEELLEARKIDPSIELAAIVPRNDEYFPEWEKRKKIVQNIIDLKFTNIATQHKNVDDLFINYCHKNDLRVFVYTLNTKKRMEKFITMGVDGIIVNSIIKAKEILKQFFSN